MKMMLGLDSLAISNICFTSLSLSPCHNNDENLKIRNDEYDDEVERQKDELFQKHTFLPHTYTYSTHSPPHSPPTHTHTCHLETKSLELMAKKVESASVATAFAKNDLPVPGGPYNKIPNIGIIKKEKKKNEKLIRLRFECYKILM
jgi:hypothetical protein